MSLLKAMIKANQPSNTQKTSKPKTKQFKDVILEKGGESVLTVVLDVVVKKDGISQIVKRTKQIEISVHTQDITYTAKYKFHYRNGFGNIVYIKTTKQDIAQQVCNYLTGEKGKYRVSSVAI